MMKAVQLAVLSCLASLEAAVLILIAESQPPVDYPALMLLASSLNPVSGARWRLATSAAQPPALQADSGSARAVRSTHQDPVDHQG